MMRWLENNFASFANVYMQIIIEVVLVGTALLYAYWLKPFMKNKRAVYVAALIYWLFFMSISHFNTPKFIDRIVAFSVIAVSFFAVFILDGRRNPVQKIFLCIVFRLISWLPLEMLSEIGFYERDFVFSLSFYRNNTSVIIIEFIIWNIFEYSLVLFLLYLALRTLHRVYRYKEDELTWQEFVMLLMPSISLMLVKPIMSSYYLLWMEGIKNGSITENIPGNPYRILFCIFSYFSVLVIIAFYQKIKSRQEDEFAMRTLEKQVADMQSGIERIENNYERMKSMKHDMVNHMTVIKGLAETGNMKELVEYINEWQERFEELQPFIKTGNAVTDVVMSEFALQCKKENIPYDCKFYYPEKLGINPFDMCVILTNALQNALEASSGLKLPHISISTVIKDRVYIINFKNKTSNYISLDEDDIPASTKHDKGHGYGLKNIRGIAEKYNGTININIIENDDRYFVLNVMLVG